MYKVKNNLSPNYICSLFQIPQLRYTLRNNDFGIPRFNTVTFGKHSLRYMGPKIWAIVPRNVRELSYPFIFNLNEESQWYERDFCDGESYHENK